ncbi:MAG: glycine zipper family protein [Candidatus Methylomirabilis sp.]
MRDTRRKTLLVLALLVATFGLSPALGSDVIIYPAKGQSPEQQNRDRYECHSWAVQQTGFDPTKPQTAQPAPPPQQAPQGGVVKGAGRGAAVGAVGGAIAGDAGKGAAVGAATGGMIGGMRRRDQQAQEAQGQQQYAQQQQAALSQGQTAYNRALGACLEGRGYTVK